MPANWSERQKSAVPPDTGGGVGTWQVPEVQDNPVQQPVPHGCPADAQGGAAWQVPALQASPEQQFPCPLPAQVVALPAEMQLPQFPDVPPEDGSTQIGADAAQQVGGGGMGTLQPPPDGMLQVTAGSWQVPETQVNPELEQHGGSAPPQVAPTEELHQVQPTLSQDAWLPCKLGSAHAKVPEQAASVIIGPLYPSTGSHSISPTVVCTQVVGAPNEHPPGTLVVYGGGQVAHIPNAESQLLVVGVPMHEEKTWGVKNARKKLAKSKMRADAIPFPNIASSSHGRFTAYPPPWHSS